MQVKSIVSRSRVGKVKNYSKFYAKLPDNCSTDSLVLNYKATINSIISRLAKLKAKLLYKSEKIYNLK